MHTNEEVNILAGSIFGEGAAVDYIMISILAFLLGACVTVFCLRLRQLRNSEGEDEAREDARDRSLFRREDES